MNKSLFFPALALTAWLPIAAAAQNNNNKVTPPSRIYYDERDLRYNPEWRSSEVTLEANLDDKPDSEIVISFIASYKPQPKTDSEKKDPFDTSKPSIPIVQNYAFTQIYRQDAGGHYQCVKTIIGMDRPQALRLLALENQGPPALAIISPGGENYVDVTILRWQEGGFQALLETGTSGDATMLSDKHPVALRIGSRTWRWDSAEKEFVCEQP
jgi:hypothetical protein